MYFSSRVQCLCILFNVVFGGVCTIISEASQLVTPVTKRIILMLRVRFLCAYGPPFCRVQSVGGWIQLFLNLAGFS